MVKHLQQMLDLGYSTRDAWPRGATPFLDITYKKLVSKPVDTVHQILNHFSIPIPEGMNEKLESYLAKRTQHRHGIHKYSLEEYGLDEVELLEKFKRESNLANG